MDRNVRFDYSKAMEFIDGKALAELKAEALSARETLVTKSGAGNDFLGWVDLPVNYDREEFARIEQAAAKIREDSDVLFVIGIGGSYLGSRAANEFLNHTFYNGLSKAERKAPEIYYVGNSISGAYLADLLDLVKHRDFSINVISKSGTTTEPAVAFRIFRGLLEKKYGVDGARERIFATTDKARGTLKEFSDAMGYETFVVPDDIGGRYSVLTSVGLLPIACAGIDVDAMMRGAADARERFLSAPFAENDCLRYAAIRNILLRKGKVTEILAAYEPAAQMLSEWWKQLYGESEGKDNRGLFPASVVFSTDLHSLGQYIQQGLRNQFETVLDIRTSPVSVSVPDDPANMDGLNFLSGSDLHDINRTAMLGTLFAHTDGSVPNAVIEIDDRSAYTFGTLVYFFELACAVSGYMLGVNPFDQPGVEAYKNNMYALLGKPGYENKRAELEKRIK